MFTIEALVQGVVVLIVLGLIVGLLFWLVDYCGLPEPFRKFAHVFLAVASVLVIICLLLGLIGHPIILLR